MIRNKNQSLVKLTSSTRPLLLLIVIIFSLIILSCGGAFKINLKPINEYPVQPKIKIDVGLLLTSDFSKYVYREQFKGSKMETDLGGQLVPHVEIMSDILFSKSTTIDDMTVIQHSDFDAVLMPVIIEAIRPNAGSGSALAMKSSYLKVKWILFDDQGDTVWSATITGIGKTKQGGGLFYKGQIRKGMEQACHDMLMKSYETISSADRIRAFAENQ